MKKWIALLVALVLLLSLAACTSEELPATVPEADPSAAPEKPVIYLYPEEETNIHVELDFNGTITSVYPAYENGWDVVASPDGTLTDSETGREYYCLFWEGVSAAAYDLKEGFVVAGADTEAFLEDTLKTLGLTDKEANEFIIYWLHGLQTLGIPRSGSAAETGKHRKNWLHPGRMGRRRNTIKIHPG